VLRNDLPMTDPAVDTFFAKSGKWPTEMALFRSIALECGLTEELKWRQPCYTHKGSNVLLIASFKDFVALSFFKGVLLQDVCGLLVKPGENSQSVRMFRCTSAEEILAARVTLVAYIYEALEVEQQGLKVPKLDGGGGVTAELQAVFSKDKQYRKAFEALSPGRQRAYNMHFAAAKQVDTRFARIDKHRNRILSGYGINDCTCGLSKRMPSCDGSHKILAK
jgi:uncharacterized protein YdeI (YjbR/CyaY-like superfamily)